MIASRTSLLRDCLCETVFLLLYEDQRYHCVLWSDNWGTICSTWECWQT